jgi:hypothetical protein
MRDVTEQLQESQAAIMAVEGTSVPKRAWEVKGEDRDHNMIERTYIQEELSFYQVQDFANIGTSYVQKFINGELGVSLKEIFTGDLKQRVQMPSMDDVNAESAEKLIDENTDLILGIIKAINKIPELEMQIMLLSLGVPIGEQKWAETILRGPVSRGGLTRQQGFDLLLTFIKQNTQAVVDFFSQQGREFVEAARKEIMGDDGDEDSEVEEVQEETINPPEETVEDADIRGGMPSSTSAPPIPVSE